MADVSTYVSKLERAQAHLDLLRDEIVPFCVRKPYRRTHQTNSDYTRHKWRIEFSEIVPLARWQLIAGDCVHNLRSALDHFVYTQACLVAGTNRPPGDRGLQFPINSSPDYWKSVPEARLHGLSDDLKNAIERFQPYNARGKRPNWSLWIIREFDDADKHQMLTAATLTTTMGSSLKLSGYKGMSPPITFCLYPMENDGVFAQVEFPSPHPDADIDADFALDVILDEIPMPDERVERSLLVPFLRQLGDDVSEIIESLATPPAS